MSDRGVYRLANAMLLQAIQDVTSSSTGRRTSALRWINSYENSTFSFSFVCRVLNRDSNEVRQFCQRKAAERRTAAFDRDRFIPREDVLSYLRTEA